MHGFTRNYIRVTAPLRKEMVNTMSRVRLEGFDSEDADSLRCSIL
mgnify:FL=1